MKQSIIIFLAILSLNSFCQNIGCADTNRYSTNGIKIFCVDSGYRWPQYGLINKNGDTVLAPDYIYIRSVKDTSKPYYIIIVNSENEGLADDNGKVLIKPERDFKIYYAQNSNLVVGMKKDWGRISSKLTVFNMKDNTYIDKKFISFLFDSTTLNVCTGQSYSKYYKNYVYIYRALCATVAWIPYYCCFLWIFPEQYGTYWDFLPGGPTKGKEKQIYKYDNDGTLISVEKYRKVKKEYYSKHKYFKHI